MDNPIDIFNPVGNIVVPIVYDKDTDFSKIINVLLVDSNVKDYTKFLENCNSSTFAITFHQGSRGQDILDLLADKLPSINRIAIVANNYGINSEDSNKLLFSYKPYFTDGDLVEGVTSYSENLQLLIDLIKAHGVKNIDFLACYSLTYDNWKSYYSILTKDTGVVVGASNDETGNLNYGGDWTMESTGMDVEATYFTSGISNYQGTLVTNSTILGNTGSNPYSIAIDSYGNVYAANTSNSTVSKITPDGASTIFGSTDTNPFNIAIDSVGNIYTTNFTKNNVTKITPDGIITKIWATTGTKPVGIAIDSSGNIYTANSGDNTVTKIIPNGTIGNGTVFGNTGINPRNIAIDSAGNIYTTNFNSNSVTKITSSGTSYTNWAITGIKPDGITIDSSGNIYTANSGDNTVTKIIPNGITGNGTVFGNTGTSPRRIVIDSVGNIYTTNNGDNTVTKITPGGITTKAWASTGINPIGIAIDSASNIYTSNYADNNVTKITPGVNSTIFGNTGAIPLDVAIDSAGNIYTTVTSNNTVTKITPDGTNYNNWANTGISPRCIAIDSADNIYITNNGSSTVTKITPDGTNIINWASTGTSPIGIVIDSVGNIYTANSNDNNVTKIIPNGTTGINTILGNTGISPRGITIDSSGNIYTANYGSNSVTKITPAGTSYTNWASTDTNPEDIAIDSAGNIYTANYLSNTVTKIVPNGTTGTSTVFGSTGTGPRSIAIDSANNIYTTNSINSTITRITSAGTVTTSWASTGSNPLGIVFDSAGNIYTANVGSNNVTKITLDSYPAPPNTASAPTVIPLDSAVKVTINLNNTSKRYGSPSSYLVRVVGDNSKSCVIGYAGQNSGTITGLVNGQSYTFETVARLGTWNTKASLASSAVTPLAPTTIAPTTAAPTTLAPTTAAPTTAAPTTLAPTTAAPTTLPPTTLPPTTLAPTTLPPTTLPPTTLPPTTLPPTTLPPNEFNEVEWSMDALYSLVESEEDNAIYRNNLISQIASVTNAPENTITILGTRNGSIINTVRLPNIYVPSLQYIIQSGLFYITIDSVAYSAISNSFVILDNICFRKGTMILTPSGYKAVESLNSGDLVKTAQDLVTKIVHVTSFIGKTEQCPLYVLHKGVLGDNKPIIDLYMSGGHAYRNNGHWCHMKCSSSAMRLDEDNIEYYNIAVDNYLEHTLVANGVEVESLFKMPELEMKWNCDKDNCTPKITRSK